jgi:hypothetical protein
MTTTTTRAFKRPMHMALLQLGARLGLVLCIRFL